MIIVDGRTGSRDLAPRIVAVHHAPAVEVDTLDYGDVAFGGNGPDGDILVGIEVKTVSDTVQSILSGRLAGHQIPGLVEQYQFPYLLIEGQHRTDPGTGTLEAAHGPKWYPVYGGYKAQSFYNALTTIQEHGNVRIRQTLNRHETAMAILALYHWFQKPWLDHDTFNVIYTPPLGGKPGVHLGRIRPEHTPVELVANVLPGISAKRALAVSNRFPTVREMVAATEKEWQEVVGVGKGTAEKVCTFLGTK